MKEVILINEENHGLIGVAKTYQGAVNFLIKENWITMELEIHEINDFSAWLSVAECCDSLEEIKRMNLEEFNDFFDGCFYLSEEEFVD